MCLAYRPTGGRIVAVLSGRPKLEMEDLFSATVPVAKRYGSKFLFRQVTGLPCWRSAPSLEQGPCFLRPALTAFPPTAGVTSAAREPEQGGGAVGGHSRRGRRLLQVCGDPRLPARWRLPLRAVRPGARAQSVPCMHWCARRTSDAGMAGARMRRTRRRCARPSCWTSLRAPPASA